MCNQHLISQAVSQPYTLAITIHPCSGSSKLHVPNSCTAVHLGAQTTKAAYVTGARVLRQDPVECLFEFICSSNNHISRIHGMVERLCRDYGTPILHSSSSQAPTAAASQAVTASTNTTAEAASKDANTSSDAPAEEQKAVPDLAFYSFPTLEQLSAASEAALRAEGFGYRCVHTSRTLQSIHSLSTCVTHHHVSASFLHSIASTKQRLHCIKMLAPNNKGSRDLLLQA